jgi:hypothetical protein
MVVVSCDSLLWVPLEFKVGKVPALIDTGAQFSYVCTDVAELLYLMGEPCVFILCWVTCALADGQRCQVTNAVRLLIRLLSFSWQHEFKVLNGGPFPAILGMYFLSRTNMLVDTASRAFSFLFAPDSLGHFSRDDWGKQTETYLQSLYDETLNGAPEKDIWPGDVTTQCIMHDFPSLFSSTLGTANCSPYDIELSDSTPL